MPFIHTRVNRPIDAQTEKELSRRLGQAVSLLGKSENWLMLQFDENCRMYFKGDCSKPVAFMSVKLYGKAGKNAYQQFTAEATRILGSVLSVPADQVYVEYEETEHWGWQGANF